MAAQVPHGVAESNLRLPSGVRINYLRAGKGEPLILLHGIGHSARAWDHTMLPLARHYDVIAPDLPGCGKSDKPDTDYSLGNQAAAVRYFMDVLEIDRATIVGHSLGGGVAMTFSYMYPERVSRLGVVSSGGLGKEISGIFKAANIPVAPKYVMRYLFHPKARLARNLATEIAFLAGADPLFSRAGGFTRDTEEMLLDMEDPRAQAAFLGMLRSSSNVLGQAISALDRLHLAEQYPVLIVWGANDRVFPVSHARRAARVLPRARVEVFQDCGHMPQLEQADKFNEVLLDWMQTTKAARVDVRDIAKTGKAPAA
ncbi:MAG TPA: alpha/beta fold hydrolase [Candidatus Dormibacteraeota bacterium]|jgi:pimeloyl-ACP methyl ester carboxylesterase|nr:alpha/beta fold hydrolase [Candidatus Dormibacteraeota bacterium]